MPHEPERLIDWTGERCVPWGDEVQGIYEHLHRYRFAASFAAGKRVLELASGEGYGAEILSRSAQKVTAVEIDPSSVAHSRATYTAPNLEFVEGSMLELDEHPDGAFDVVVCFEALEHVDKQETLLAGIRRVLTKEGVLILSTPDRETYNAQIHEPNPFHVRELDRAQLLDLLGKYFAHTMLWGQSGVGGSRLAMLDGKVGRRFSEELVERRSGVWVDLDDAPPPYLVAVASPSPFAATPPDSYLLDPTAAALRERDRRLVAREARIRELKGENAELHRENERLRGRSLRRRVRSMLARLAPSSRWCGT